MVLRILARSVIGLSGWAAFVVVMIALASVTPLPGLFGLVAAYSPFLALVALPGWVLEPRRRLSSVPPPQTPHTADTSTAPDSSEQEEPPSLAA